MEYTPHIVRVFMPDLKPEEIETLKDNKPFALHARVPASATFLQFVAIPSLIDLMGFSGGGGVPGFAFLIDPREEEMEDIVFVVRYPEQEVWLPKDNEESVDPLGIAQVMGMLMAGFSIRGVELESLRKQISEVGGTIFGTKHYTVPAFLQQMTLRKVQAAGNATPSQ